MNHQVKGKSLAFVPKIIVLDIEIVKVVQNKSDPKPDDEPAKQHFQVFIANPPEKQTTATQPKQIKTTENTTQG